MSGRLLEPIRSTANARVRAWARLKSGRRRREANRFLVDGEYEVRQAIEGGLVFEEILFREDLAEEIVDRLRENAEACGFPLRPLAREALEKVSLREKPDGVIGVGITPSRDFALPENLEGPIVVATRLEKPGNLGAIIRTAYAAGAAGVVLCDPAVDFENPQVIRASRGLVFRLPGWVASSLQAKEVFQKRSLSVYAADKKGEDDLWNVPWSRTPVIVLGEEHAGLAEPWSGDGIQRVRIPMREGIDSLNVSVSGALFLYEWRRRMNIL